MAFVFLRPINLDPNCTDVLEIRDGLDASSPLLRRYCSSEPTPQTIFSSGREMYVRFKSDGYNRRDVFRDESVEQGFHATYFVTRVRSGSVSATPVQKLSKSLSNDDGNGNVRKAIVL